AIASEFFGGAACTSTRLYRSTRPARSSDRSHSARSAIDAAPGPLFNLIYRRLSRLMVSVIAVFKGDFMQVPCVSVAAMRRTTTLIALASAVLTFAAGSARAQPYGGPPGPPTPRPVWDSRGWVMLGERTVNGRVDHDRIEVGRYEGRFNKLTLVVENSDMEL